MLDAHDLPDDVDHLKRLVLEHRSRVQAQQLEIERLKIQLSRLRRWKFGRSSEQLDLQIAQIELTLQVLQAVTPPVTTTVAAPTANHNVSAIRERRAPARRALPAHLPRETVVHVSPSVRNGCTCAQCGRKLRKLGQDVAEMLELVPAYFKVIRHVREKHSCATCAGIVQAPAPSRPIERGLPGPGLLGHVVAGKYCYHQPLYRQSEVYGLPACRSIARHSRSGWAPQADS